MPTVLVVDDCDDARELFRAVLEREGFRVIAASDGADALAAAALHRPHVVVTDLAMPAMDGFEVVRRLRAAQREDETLRVLVVSAFSDGETVRRARAVGCDDYLIKPCTGPALVDRVRAALQDRGAETP